MGMEDDLHGDNCCDRLLRRLLQKAVDIFVVVADQGQDHPAFLAIRCLTSSSVQKSSRAASLFMVLPSL